ncbi:Uncharacterised protein [Mycobacteroides abscessus subsp. abscessus]|nr:Uncharacterised protein [Mycobacteroides abscessus subsp. abscessus]
MDALGYLEAGEAGHAQHAVIAREFVDGIAEDRQQKDCQDGGVTGQAPGFAGAPGAVMVDGHDQAQGQCHGAEPHLVDQGVDCGVNGAGYFGQGQKVGVGHRKAKEPKRYRGAEHNDGGLDGQPRG